ncbi:MAG: hypothetical protein KDA80_11525 [Planctomycetaceae bacterium]|nr:hypothetical protein [Planctomycetaceae bacterium]
MQFLKNWITGKSRKAKLWPGTWATNRGGGEMIRAVLEAAEISYEIDDR